MQRITSAALAAALICSAGVAFAAKPDAAVATLLEVKGSVLVDKGEGFAPVAGPVSLKLGDRVTVNGDGQAVLSYGEDCKFPLQSPSVTTVASAGCVVGTQARTFNARNAAPIIGFALSSIPIFAAVAAEVIDNDDEDDDDEDSPTGQPF